MPAAICAYAPAEPHRTVLALHSPGTMRGLPSAGKRAWQTAVVF
jgi:hypothetical protein